MPEGREAGKVLEYRPDGWRMPLLWVVAFLYPVALAGQIYLYTRPGWGVLPIVTALFFTGIWYFALSAVLHRNRPILRFGDGWVTGQTIWAWKESDPIPIEDIANVHKSWAAITFERRSGEHHQVRLLDLSRESRASMESELARRMAAVSGRSVDS